MWVQFFEREFGNPEGFSATKVDEADLVLVFPFNRSLASVSVNDYATDAELVRADLRDASNAFCMQHQGDPDCGPEEARPIPPCIPFLGMALLVILAARKIL